MACQQSFFLFWLWFKRNILTFDASKLSVDLFVPWLPWLKRTYKSCQSTSRLSLTNLTTRLNQNLLGKFETCIFICSGHSEFGVLMYFSLLQLSRNLALPSHWRLKLPSIAGSICRRSQSWGGNARCLARFSSIGSVKRTIAWACCRSPVILTHFTQWLPVWRVPSVPRGDNYIKNSFTLVTVMFYVLDATKVFLERTRAKDESRTESYQRWSRNRLIQPSIGGLGGGPKCANSGSITCRFNSKDRQKRQGLYS